MMNDANMVPASLVRQLYWHLLRPQKGRIFGYFLMLLLAIGLQAPIPFLLSRLVDGLSQGVAFASLTQGLAYIVGLSIFSQILSTASQIFQVSLNRRFFLAMRMSVFNALQKAAPSFARGFKVSDLHARFTGDMAALNHFLPTGFANALRHICCIVVFGSILIHLSPTVVLYIVWLLPVAALIFTWSSKRLSVLAAEAHASYADANATILESLNGLRESRVTGSGAFHQQRLRQSLERCENKIVRARTYSVLMFGALGIIPIIVTVLIWAVGGWKIAAGELTVGKLVSFMLVLSMLYGPINGLFSVASGYIYELAAFKRIAGLFRGLDSGQDSGQDSGLGEGMVLGPDKMNASILSGPDAWAASRPASLVLRNLSFAYAGNPVFDTFGATIPTGRCTTLIGSNGSGKSTLLSIVCGLEAPAGGCVLLNGMSPASLDAGYLAHHFGYLPQDIFIFGDSLRMNITMGREIADEQILAALAELGLQEFLSGWEQGLDTVILESGRNLSGGQKQKIGLLRAVVNQPGILVLDEPENNLDQRALDSLVGYLQKLKGRCTVLLVTHGNAFQALVDHTVDLSAATLRHEVSARGNGQYGEAVWRTEVLA